ncbi:uncharacterized protein [Argopecten irradians]|uniref:uncharacterized protein n=1 Tax=Argopecten irradians TaxID=31199 RepID=UPI003716A817
MNQLVLVHVFAFASILLLSAPIAVDTAETCSTNANSTSCCSANCGWFECTGNDTNAIKACMNLTDTDTINKTCSGSTNQTDLQSKCPAACKCKETFSHTITAIFFHY